MRGCSLRVVRPPLKPRSVALLIVVVALLATFLSPVASAQTVADIETRDTLIANQEALLNVYRCMFDVDTEIVPGGCVDGIPTLPAEDPKPFAGTPTAGEQAGRDKLIGNQESLLNVYRCLFDIDTRIVPNGCVDGAPVPTPSPTPTLVAVITVPAEAPEGRCSHAVSGGTYSWEVCAWRGYLDSPTVNPPLSSEDAADLIGRIWDEVEVDGKPEFPPTITLISTESECARSGFIGCYWFDDHHIDRLDVFQLTLLHEVAHSLIVEHPDNSICEHLSGFALQRCLHNDIFRCVADHLYEQYARIPPAGVCGTAAKLPPPKLGSNFRSLALLTAEIWAEILEEVEYQLGESSAWYGHTAKRSAAESERRRQIWLADPDGTVCEYDKPRRCGLEDCSQWRSEYNRTRCPAENEAELQENYVPTLDYYCESLEDEAGYWDLYAWKTNIARYEVGKTDNYFVGPELTEEVADLSAFVNAEIERRTALRDAVYELENEHCLQ